MISLLTKNRGRSALLAHVPFLLILTGACFYLFGTLISGFSDNSHENLSAALRLGQYLNELNAGFLHPQLFMDGILGAGHAFPVFYPPLSYFFSLVIYAFCGNLIVATNLSFFSSALFSGYTSYAAGYVMSRNRWVALAGAVLYITASYRFTNIFVRGALAESWFLVWPPLVLFGVVKLMKGKRFWIPIATGVACCILTHAVMTLWLGLFFLLANIAVFAARGWKGNVQYGLAGILGLGIAAFFVIPQQVYLPDVFASMTHYMWAGWDHLEHHRVFIFQLFLSDPDRYTGGSSPTDNILNDTMDFSIGLGGIIAVLMAGIWKWKSLITNPRCFLKPESLLISIMISCWLFYLVGLVNPALLKWLPEKFGYLQFPWRLLGLLAFLHFFLFCATARIIIPRKHLTIAMLALILVMIVSVPHYYNNRQLRETAEETIRDEAFVQDTFDARHGFTSIMEYLPTEFEIWPARNNWQNYELPPAGIVGGEGEIISFEKINDGEIQLSVESTDNATVFIPLIAYPFWKVATSEGTELETGSVNGMLVFAVPTGNQQIQITRHYTTPYFISWAISLLSLIILIALHYFPEIRKVILRKRR